MPHLTKLLAPRALSAFVLSAACALAAPAALAAREQASTAPLPAAIEPAESLEGNFLSAYIAGAARDTTAAAAYYREAVKDDPRNPELLERAFVSYLADGAMPEAFKSADRLIARQPTNGLAQLALGVRDLKEGRYQAARQHLGKGGRGRAADLTATLLSAWAYAGAGDGKRALDTIDRLKGERAYNVFRDYHAGLIAWVTGNKAEAERRLKAAYDGEHNTLRIVDAYGRLESQLGKKDAAVAAYKGFDDLLPRHPMVRAALDALQAGKTLAPFVTTAQEGAAEVLYGLGAAGNQQGDELPAIIYLRLALYLDPANSMALVTLADIEERLKQYDDAMAVLKRIPEESPIRASADVQIGLILEQLKRGDEAVEHLKATIERHPDNVEAITALGNVLRSRKQYAEAADVYTKAIEQVGASDRSNWSLYYFRGSAYERSKQWPKAEADLRKALELVPDTQPSGRAQVLNYLAYSWVDRGENIDEAFKMLKRAVELSPRDGMIIDSLGWAYYRLGRYDDAVRELEKAIELKPGDPVINDHLGDAFWKIGRKLEAKFQWQHAKDSNPEPEDLAKIDEKLANGLEEEKPAAAKLEPAPEGAPATTEPAPDGKSGG